MTRTDIYAILGGFLFAALAAWVWQDPVPLDVKRIGATKGGASSTLAGVVHFDEDGARALRLRLGHMAEQYEDGDRSYALTVTDAGVRPTTAKFFPTDEEFGAWLALPAGHEFEYDLDGYLESTR